MYTYEDVNKGIAAVVEYLKETEYIWNINRNLKLYDVYYKCDDIIEDYPHLKKSFNASDLFEWFCEDSYEQFKDWVDEDLKCDYRKYIGFTSSFYLTDYHDDMKEVFYYLLNHYFGPSNILLDNNFEMKKLDYLSPYAYFTTEEEYIEYSQPEMEYVSDGSFLRDIKEDLEDARKEADYIDDFRKNQIKYFKEWLEFQEEQAKENELDDYETEANMMACYI